MRPKLGLALSGGAARGIAHLGVLKVFAEENIPIDFIAGTSAGSIAAGGYASGLSVDDMLALGEKLSWFNIGKFSFSLFGLQSNEPLEIFIRENYPIKKIEDLKIPFAAVATDLDTGNAVVFDKGDLAFAIRASSNIPGLYVPCEDGQKRRLVDGGVVQLCPVETVKKMGADVVVAVDVNSEGANFLGFQQTAIGVLAQSAYLLMRSGIKPQLAMADLVVAPKLGHMRWDEIKRAKEFVELGEKAARERLDEIWQLIA